MKKLLLLVLICFAQNTFSQSKNATTTVPDKENQIYDIKGIDSKPDFPGGIENFQKFLNENFVAPQDKPKLKGKVYATFIIEKDGSLSDIKIIKDLGFGTKEEAIRVLQLAPKWIPGKLKGAEVRTLNATAITVR